MTASAANKRGIFYESSDSNRDFGTGTHWAAPCTQFGGAAEFAIAAGVDPYLTPEKEQAARDIGIPAIGTDPELVFADPNIEAVAILSTTETHSDFIIRAAKAGKAIFCEKPIDHNVDRILDALRTVRETGAVLQVGFSHRFDKHHARVGALVADGKVGDVNFVRIISRDRRRRPMNTSHPRAVFLWT